MLLTFCLLFQSRVSLARPHIILHNNPLCRIVSELLVSSYIFLSLPTGLYSTPLFNPGSWVLLWVANQKTPVTHLSAKSQTHTPQLQLPELSQRKIRHRYHHHCQRRTFTGCAIRHSVPPAVPLKAYCHISEIPTVQLILFKVQRMFQTTISTFLRKRRQAEVTCVQPQKEMKFREVTVYLLERRMGKSRRNFLTNLARSKGFIVDDTLRYVACKTVVFTKIERLWMTDWLSLWRPGYSFIQGIKEMPICFIFECHIWLLLQGTLYCEFSSHSVIQAVNLICVNLYANHLDNVKVSCLISKNTKMMTG